MVLNINFTFMIFLSQLSLFLKNLRVGKYEDLFIIIAPAYSKVRYRGSTFRPFVRPSVHNLCPDAYSVAVIAGSMKPCIVITLDTHFKKAP